MDIFSKGPAPEVISSVLFSSIHFCLFNTYIIIKACNFSNTFILEFILPFMQTRRVMCLSVDVANPAQVQEAVNKVIKICCWVFFY